MYYTDNINITYKSGASNYKYEGTQPHAVTKIENNTGTISPMLQDITTYTPFNKVESIFEFFYEKRFTYGPFHARKKVDSYEYGDFKSTKYYVGNYEKEISGSDTKEIHYIGGVDGLAAVYIIDNGIGTLYYVCTDHLGSIVALVDESGTIIEEHSYDAWGRRRNHATWISPASWTYEQEPGLLTRGFTGHEHIDEFGLINMNGRIYDPILGTFLSPDNYVQFPDYSQSLNRYSYALNNPLVYVDPDGESVFLLIAFTLAGAYLGGVGANYGEFNPAQWDLESAETYLGIGFGALFGYVAGYGILHSETVGLAVGITTSAGGLFLVGSGSDWSFQWTTTAGGGGEIPLQEEKGIPQITSVNRPEYYDERFYHGTETEAIEILVASSKIKNMETAVYELEYGYYYEYTSGYRKISASEPYIGDDLVIGYADGYYITYYENTLEQGRAYSAFEMNKGLYIRYGFMQTTWVNQFYHTHANNTPLGYYDPFQDLVPCWAVGWDKVKRNNIIYLPSIDAWGN